MACAEKWTKLRQSKTLVVTVVFVAMMLDLIMLTTLEPILPDMIYNIDHPQGTDGVPVPLNGSNRSIISQPDLLGTTDKVGVVLAVKPGTEIVANLFVGYLVDRLGHKYPMVVGCMGNLVATLSFAFANSFWILVLARVVQAIASSLSVVSGLALLAAVFQSDEERSKVNAIAFGGLSFGMIVGFPFGSTTYQFLGRAAPFIILALLMFMDGALRLFIQVPTEVVDDEDKKPATGALTLCRDPYIAVGLGCNLVEHIGLGIIIATEAAWMIGRLGAEQWAVGVVLVVGAIFQFAAQIIAGVYAVRAGRWLFCVFGLIITAVGTASYPFCTTQWQVFGPEVVARLGIGAILGVISPLLGYIVDLRHSSNYGAIYGLYAASYNLGLVVGPLFGGTLVKYLTFGWLYRGTALLLVSYSGVCVIFRRLERKKYEVIPPEEREKLYSTLTHESMKYGSTSRRRSSLPQTITPGEK